MRIPFALIVVFPLLSAVCAAQTVATGTFEISGVTNVNANRQTISTTDENGRLQPGNAEFTSIVIGCEVTYYITPRVGIGALINHQKVSVDAPERDTILSVSGAFYGPLVQVRLPLDDRSDFVVAGSGGGVRTHGVNQSSEVTNEAGGDAVGRYWLLGGGLSVRFNPNASFDASVRYQSSAFTAPNGAPNKTTSAGLLVGIGVSLYIH